MKHLIISFLVLFCFSFAADTNYTPMSVAGKGTATIPLALGASITVIPTNGILTANLVIPATTGKGELSQIISLSSVGNAITTINAVTLTNMVIGDIVMLQSNRASEDSVVVDDGATIYLGAATRTLDGLADMLLLQKFSSTAVREIGFVDNN